MHDSGCHEAQGDLNFLAEPDCSRRCHCSAGPRPHIGPRGLVFVVRDSGPNNATHTKSDVYFDPLRTLAETTTPPAPQIAKTGERRRRGRAARPRYRPAPWAAFSCQWDPRSSADKDVHVFASKRDGHGLRQKLRVLPRRA